MRLPVPGRPLGAALLLPALVALTVAWHPWRGAGGTAHPAVAPNPTVKPMATAPTTNVSLKWQVDRRVQAAALRTAVNVKGERVRMGDILRNAPYTATPNCDAPKKGAMKNMLKTPGYNWYCLMAADAEDKDWTPQGVSGTDDAYPEGTVDGRHAIAFSWHAGPVGVRPAPPGARLTFLDTDPKSNKYEHVLLVRPTEDGKSYEDVTTHAGGIVWFTHYVFVVSVTGGVSVFDTADMLGLLGNPQGNVTDRKRIGAYTDPVTHKVTYYGHGYSYLLPEIGQWHNQDPKTTYDYMSLPANRDNALTGEWCNYKDSCNYRGRVLRWSMPELLGFEKKGFKQVITPIEAWFQPYPGTQGGFSNKCYYFDNGGGIAGSDGHLITAWADGSKPVVRVGGKGLQDLYWRRSDNQLWTVTEHPGVGRRVLYGIDRPSCP